jgi:hypothetical protein
MNPGLAEILMGVRPPAVPRLAGHTAAIAHLSSLVPVWTAVAPRAELIDSGAKFVQLAKVILLVPVRHGAIGCKDRFLIGGCKQDGMD